jgi:hypothetical protein
MDDKNSTTPHITTPTTTTTTTTTEAAFNFAAGFSVVAGGYGNTVSGTYSVIGGGQTNIVTQSYGTASGGVQNSLRSNYGNVGGGAFNTVTGRFSAIPAGRRNTIAGRHTVVLGAGGSTTGPTSDHVLLMNFRSDKSDTVEAEVSTQNTIVLQADNIFFNDQDLLATGKRVRRLATLEHDVDSAVARLQGLKETLAAKLQVLQSLVVG